MIYNVIVNPSAERDLDEALDWYYKQRKGLEKELYLEVSEILEYISKYPLHFQMKYREFRVRYTKRFNYGIHYIIEGDTIFVHAILHTSRKPRS